MSTQESSPSIPQSEFRSPNSGIPQSEFRNPQFSRDLARFGPDSGSSVALDEARAYCARLAASHYENFSVVTRLTPRELRPAFAAVYGFCRWSDDLGDEVGDRDESRRLLAWWRG